MSRSTPRPPRPRPGGRSASTTSSPAPRCPERRRRAGEGFPAMRLAQRLAARPRVPWRHAAIAVAISFAVAAGYFLRLHAVAPFSALEMQTLGWRFQIRGPIAPPDMLAILAIDDRTIA